MRWRAAVARRMSAVGKGGRRGEDEDGGRAQSRSGRGVRMVPREPGVGTVPCLCTCETLCERSRGMSFICAWHRFGAQVRSAEQAGVLGLLAGTGVLGLLG